MLGPSFVRHPLSRSLWIVFWLATAGMVIAYRFGLPLVRTLRHRLTVVEVRPEGPGVVSVICKGRRLERLAVSGGQFFEWRFLTRGMWWQAHPFSLSARPKPPYLRLTVKDRGDFSAAVASLQPGTRVAIEGPYGVFTSHARRRRKAVLIAGRHRRHRHPCTAGGPAEQHRTGRVPPGVDRGRPGPVVRGGRAGPASQGPRLQPCGLPLGGQARKGGPARP